MGWSLQEWLNSPGNQNRWNNPIRPEEQIIPEGPDNQIRQPAPDMAQVKSSFLEACRNGNKGTMRKLLREHSELIKLNMLLTPNGDTALHLACREGHLTIVESLLDLRERAVDVNIENSNGDSPLFVAAAAGHVGIVKRLLRMKGLKLKEGCGEKTVVQAVRNGHFESAQLIMSAIEKRRIAISIVDPENILPSSLNRYVRLTSELRSRSAKTEYDVQKINLQLETYRKSILSIVNPSEPKTATVPDVKKSLKESIDELGECLECTICCENFDEMKVFACTKDHWICSRCLPRNDRCPSCREDFNAHPPTRRVTCEKFLAMVKDHLSLCDE